MHLVLSGVEVQVGESRNWHSGDLVREHFHHVELQAQYVCEPEERNIFLIVLFNDCIETHLTFRPVVCLALAPDLRLLVFLSLLGDLSACLDGEEEAMETLPGSLNGFGQRGEEIWGEEDKELG